MKVSGNIRKMYSQLASPVEYELPLYNVLEFSEAVPMNQFVGKPIRIEFNNAIHCVVTGKKINKTFGEGMSYDAFMNSPLAVESIIRPELSRIHEGVALRDEAWEREHHLTPHNVYLSLTSEVKVGVTRTTQVPTRWIDQGAVAAIVLAETPYRQAAGLIEVSLKQFLADKTNWRAMLKNEVPAVDLLAERNRIQALVADEYQEFMVKDSEIVGIQYPVIEYPTKLKSLKLDSNPVIEKTLMGIKGQYLLFHDNSVMNVRSHAGYSITLEA